MKKKLIILASLGILTFGACSFFRKDCEPCNGTGSIVSFWGVKIECSNCDGKGYVAR